DHALAQHRRALQAEEALESALGVLVARVRLAGEQPLHRTIPGEQRQRALGVVAQHAQPLVGGDPAGEPERQRLRVEAAHGGLHVLRLVAAAEAVLHAALAGEAHEVTALRLARGPQLLVRYAVDPAPGARVVRVAPPALAEVAVEQ